VAPRRAIGTQAGAEKHHKTCNKGRQAGSERQHKPGYKTRSQIGIQGEKHIGKGLE
jgi:hypothetical protein